MKNYLDMQAQIGVQIKGSRPPSTVTVTCTRGRCPCPHLPTPEKKRVVRFLADTYTKSRTCTPNLRCSNNRPSSNLIDWLVGSLAERGCLID